MKSADDKSKRKPGPEPGQLSFGQRIAALGQREPKPKPEMAKADGVRRRATVWVYVNTAKKVGDEDYVKAFASGEAAERWCAKNDPEGVAFVCLVNE